MPSSPDAVKNPGRGSSSDMPISETVTETPREARQGLLGRPVLLVLGVSLLLAIIAGLFVAVIRF